MVSVLEILLLEVLLRQEPEGFRKREGNVLYMGLVASNHQCRVFFFL